jgi:hypothetical protein
MALTTQTVGGTLGAVFARKTVNGVLESMQSGGTIAWGPGAELTPHNAAVALLACALPEEDASRALAAAMKMRDWMPTGAAPGRQLAAGMKIEGLSDVRLIRVMIAGIYCRQPSAWWIAPIEVVGHGLVFGPPDEAPSRLERRWKVVTPSVLAELGRHGDGMASPVNRLLLDRVGRSLRP